MTICRFLSLLMLFSCLEFSAQQAEPIPKTGAGFEIHYRDTLIEYPDYSIRFYNIKSDRGAYRIAVGIYNKSTDYLALNMRAITFLINNKEIHCKDSFPLLIQPYYSRARYITIRLKDSMFSKFSIKFDGLSRLIPADTTEMKPHDFFSEEELIQDKKFKIEILPKRVMGVFIRINLRCTYIGDKIGLVVSDRSSIRFSNGREIEAIESPRSFALYPKSSKKFQFKYFEATEKIKIKKSNPIVFWNHTFYECREQKLEPIFININYNSKLTTLKPEWINQ